ncbi:hypothetical protein ACWEFL_02930 [Streptomyces sp. NPDC004838]
MHRTDDRTEQASPVLPVPRMRWCHWHGALARTTVEIVTIERMSGPPVTLYACGPCVHALRLTVA